MLGFVVFCILWMTGYGVEFVMEILIHNISRLPLQFVYIQINYVRLWFINDHLICEVGGGGGYHFKNKKNMKIDWGKSYDTYLLMKWLYLFKSVDILLHSSFKLDIVCHMSHKRVEQKQIQNSNKHENIFKIFE